MKNKYIIVCPKCNTSHNVSEQMVLWKEELFEEINKLIKKIFKK